MTEKASDQLVHFIVQYIFENDDGNIDADFCMPEIAAGRCGRRGQEREMDVEQCTRCLTELLQERAAKEDAKPGSAIYKPSALTIFTKKSE